MRFFPSITRKRINFESNHESKFILVYFIALTLFSFIFLIILLKADFVSDNLGSLEILETDLETRNLLSA